MKCLAIESGLGVSKEGFRYMRIAAFGAGVVLSCAILTVANNQNVSAQSSAPFAIDRTSQMVDQMSDKLAVLAMVNNQAVPETEPQPEPVKHIVQDGETLSAIAEKHQTNWQRLFAKNTQLDDPNLLTPNQELIIPMPDEQVPDRPIPVTQPVKATSSAKKQASQVINRGSSDGNTYSWGYCTWYAKSRRPDLPNNLGNAYTWVSRAAAQGIPTGSTPQAGAIGQRGNHVVYVESVNGDGTIKISEMNYQAVGVVTVRVVSASEFQYIY